MDGPRIDASPRRATRRAVLAGGVAAIAAAWSGRHASAAGASVRPPGVPTARVEVWKSPSCGCCRDWIDHLAREGFEVVAHDTGNTGARRRLGLPERFGSCHTAAVGGYVLEGHVPAREIRRLLSQRPDVLGLAVPGMPVGSPGMDGPVYGDRRDPYDVLAIRRDGTAAVYASYR
jgi:hypothetical protein